MVNQSLTYEHFMSVALSLGRRGLGPLGMLGLVEDVRHRSAGQGLEGLRALGGATAE